MAGSGGREDMNEAIKQAYGVASRFDWFERRGKPNVGITSSSKGCAMTPFPSQFLALTNRLSWQLLWPGRFLSPGRRRHGVTVVDPEALTEAQRRDIGLLDGRGPGFRRPERDPSAGPWL